MLTLEKLRNQFYPVETIGTDLVRCGDELPGRTIHTYVRLCGADGCAPLLVSEDLVDDAFAAQVLHQAGCTGVVRPSKRDLQPNRYGFTHLLEVPPHYHAELKGRLDAERMRTTLCIPIFGCEFSGDETPEDFHALRGRLVPTSRWNRPPCPRISLRFDNPRTGGGTGERTVFATFDQVLREIANLAGVQDGFIELYNHRGEIVELVYRPRASFSWIEGRDDAAARLIDANAIRDTLWTFVTR
ncbi:hypothetical protein [Bradyrhizobium sp. 2TAF24]|uniref:hypothetical protein n=1 Tax=Bradyrhizobium sp. 2TAF24 TaxID=3233011 RepID=UPI003F8E6161